MLITPTLLRFASFLLTAGLLAQAAPDPAAAEFFENQIRPLLAERCYSCHSAKAEKLKGDLRLDTKAGVAKGGTTGPLLVAGKPAESLLIQAIRGTAKDLDLMPPKGDPLKAEQIAALEAWVKMGAPDPREDVVVANPAATHWAFRKPVAPKVPEVQGAKFKVQNPIDRFVQAKLAAKGLTAAPPADKHTLLRRITFDLTGLPPTPSEMRDFLADDSPEAFSKVADRLLASPRYGERWGRHWLDVARYADSKGYVFEEERRYAYAYTYRDWVVNALNRDLPYDQFLIQQIAGDQVATKEDPWPLAAEGFLTLGRRFLNNTPDIIDDRLDVVFRGTMALTVGCARCHDHKFDPIPTADYYSLYGVFDSSHEPGEKPLLGPNPNPQLAAQYAEERAKREAELTDFRTERTADVLKKLRDRVGDYLLAAHDSLGLDWTNLEGLARVRSLDPGLVAAWKTRFEQWRGAHNPIFAPWFAFASLSTNDFPAQAKSVTEKFRQPEAGKPLNSAVAQSFLERPPTNFAEVAVRFGMLLTNADTTWTTKLEVAKKANQPAPQALVDAAQEQLRLVLTGGDSPVKEAMKDIDRFFDTPTAQKLRGLRRKLDELDATHPGAPLRAMALNDNATPNEPVVFKRGNPGSHGAKVPRQFLGIVAGPDRKPFTKGSGRHELAQAIVSRENPLTARVFVNRVWLRYFGAPLVRTPSDFGVRSDPPINPELLDHLAVWFMDHDWSLKQLHRYLVLSATYQQASDPGDEAKVQTAFTRNEKADPANQLLWRMNRKRVDYEAMRDSLLAVSGQLDGNIGGQPVEIFEGKETPRRTLYGFIDRQNLPGVLRAFDFASPDSTSAMRFQTTVPQQALFLMNSSFMATQARAFVTRPDLVNAQPAEKLARLNELAFQRSPTREETAQALAFLNRPASAPPEPVPAATWSYGTGEFDSATGRVKNWHVLPHFTGKAWQHEEKLPSAKGLYTMLNAEGGHPGHAAADSAIRRWTAPLAGTVRIRGTLNHPGEPGDGVRGRIVSSRAGELGSWVAHHGKQKTEVAEVKVGRGDTLDFVIEPQADENTDSFTWSPVIELTGEPAAAGTGARNWDAKRDFAGPQDLPKPLTPWEQYAQVLLSANEFVFVD
jgi:mono/diheme cytochrome c family protein